MTREVALDDGARRVAYAAAKESKNPALTHVRIGKGEIVAADGCILARRPLLATEEDGYALVPAKALLKAKRPSIRQPIVVAISENGAPSQVIGQTTETVALGTGNYPGIDLLEPKEATAATFCLALDLLKKLVSLAGDADYVRFEYLGELHAPVKYTAGDTRGLIMPMAIRAEIKEEK